MEDLGRDYILKTFEIHNDPETQLYLFDYFENAGNERGNKIEATIRLIDWLLQNNTPSGGFGIQGHLVASQPFTQSEGS